MTIKVRASPNPNTNPNPNPNPNPNQVKTIKGALQIFSTGVLVMDEVPPRYPYPYRYPR